VFLTTWLLEIVEKNFPNETNQLVSIAANLHKVHSFICDVFLKYYSNEGDWEKIQHVKILSWTVFLSGSSFRAFMLQMKFFLHFLKPASFIFLPFLVLGWLDKLTLELFTTQIWQEKNKKTGIFMRPCSLTTAEGIKLSIISFWVSFFTATPVHVLLYQRHQLYYKQGVVKGEALPNRNVALHCSEWSKFRILAEICLKCIIL